MSKRSLTFPGEVCFVCKGATGDVSEEDVYLFSFSFYEKQASDSFSNCFVWPFIYSHILSYVYMIHYH